MKYFCAYCSYSYDESIGDEIEGIEPGTRVSDFDYCPNCEEESSFQGVEEEVNYLPQDKSDYDGLELEHDIEYDYYDGNIDIGLPNHPCGEDHRITEISIYDEYGDLVIDDILDAEAEPEISFYIGDLDDFEIRAKCSRHGIWAKNIKN